MQYEFGESIKALQSYKLQVFYLSDAQNDTGSDWALKFLRQDAAQTYHNKQHIIQHNITMTYTLHKYYEHNLHIINIEITLLINI